jgi:hypothetical protein
MIYRIAQLACNQGAKTAQICRRSEIGAHWQRLPCTIRLDRELPGVEGGLMSRCMVDTLRSLDAYCTLFYLFACIPVHSKL